jgi:hypothetical protein
MNKLTHPLPELARYWAEALAGLGPDRAVPELLRIATRHLPRRHQGAAAAAGVHGVAGGAPETYPTGWSTTRYGNDNVGVS